MTRHIRFTFLCNDQEREAITKIAEQLQRSQSDAVRFVILTAANQVQPTGSIETDERLQQPQVKTHGSE